MEDIRMPLHFVRNNITKMKVDAIVNTANTKLQRGGGVCGAIFQAANSPKLQEECNALAPCKTGDAVITKGYYLPAKFIIHAVGPIYRGGTAGEDKALKSCYRNALQIAVKHHCASVAFPLISSGIYGYPKPEALQIAEDTIKEFLKDQELTVYLVFFDKASFELGQQRFHQIQQFIDETYVEEQLKSEPRRMMQVHELCEVNEPAELSKRSLDEMLGQLEETFSQCLLRLIDEKGLNDVEVYKRANIDRKLFSKIRSNSDYKPSKATVLSFAIALSLNLYETRDLLTKAGYSLSHSSYFDIIIEYHILEHIYDIFTINEALFQYDMPTLGA